LRRRFRRAINAQGGNRDASNPDLAPSPGLDILAAGRQWFMADVATLIRHVAHCGIQRTVIKELVLSADVSVTRSELRATRSTNPRLSDRKLF